MASTSVSSHKQEKGKFVPSEYHVLQKHAFFFDRNQDGVVYPRETYRGFRALGCNIFLSTAGAIFVNMALSQKTRPGKFPSLRFPIEISNIQRAKHGSDTDVFDTEGRFVPEKFEEIFAKYAKTHTDALTSDELMAMVKANREPMDFVSWFAAWSEWKLLFHLTKDKNGLLHKDTLRSFYDGSLFFRMEEEREASKKKKKA